MRELVFKVVQTAEIGTIAKAPAFSELCAEARGNTQQQLYEAETESSSFTGAEAENREAKQPAPGHTASEMQGSDSEPGCLAQNPLPPP